MAVVRRTIPLGRGPPRRLVCHYAIHLLEFAMVSYDYVLAIWVRLQGHVNSRKLRTYLEGEYQILSIEIFPSSGEDAEDESTISLQVQVNFEASQMDGDEPTPAAIAEFDRDLRSYLEAKYSVNYMEVLDDALTSYLLAEREDDDSSND